MTIRFRTKRLYIEAGNTRVRRLGIWIPDALHIWWRDSGVHLFWSSRPHIERERVEP